MSAIIDTNPVSLPRPPSTEFGFDNGTHNHDDTTVTSRRQLARMHKPDDPADDLALLAVSAQMTEISYSISDIQTRIFEIQELRHRTLEETGATNSSEGASSVIDEALINLDERLEAVSNSISVIDEALGVTPGAESKSHVDPALLRKHAVLIEEWDSVQTDAETLRDELKEDKWLAVFRTVSEQAEGMMASLEKGVTQCHDFIFQFQRRAGDDHQSSISSATAPIVNYETFTTLLQAFEAKKKYYMPSITKVLSVLDKGVRDRVTKNGECLRRHADLRARWHNLRERIGRTDADMEAVRRQLVNRDLEPSEAGSAVSSYSGHRSRNGVFSVASSRTPSTASRVTLSRSISPFSNWSSSAKKFASKVGDKIVGRSTPSALLTPPSSTGSIRVSNSMESPTARKSSSFFPFRSTNAAPSTPTRGHGHSQSIQSDTMSTASAGTSTHKAPKERWNISTKVEPELATVKAPPLRKRPSASNISAAGLFRSPSPGSAAFSSAMPATPARDSTSRPSPSRPGSRLAAPSAKTTPAKPAPPRSHTPSQITPPRAQTPGGTVISRTNARTPGGTVVSRAGAYTPGGTLLPRARPTTPSHIPAPRPFLSSNFDVDDEDYLTMPTSIMQRMSPSSPSSSGHPRPNTPSHHPRTPSSSMIPVPRLSISSDSRPNSPSALRSHTPEATLRARAGRVPFFSPGASTSGRSSGSAPSSFHGHSGDVPTSSRPSSRASVTPGFDNDSAPSYAPVKTDPLDVEVARCVNGFPHSFLVERIDPPLRAPPKNLEEIRAQYAVSNALARKVITCRLVIISRPKGTPSGVAGLTDSGEQRKVMCRVGGGWLDLQMYLLNRQAGMA